MLDVHRPCTETPADPPMFPPLQSKRRSAGVGRTKCHCTETPAGRQPNVVSEASWSCLGLCTGPVQTPTEIQLWSGFHFQ